MSSEARVRQVVQSQTTESDFGWSLGMLLRAYQRASTGALGGFPHGQRGYQALSTVVHGDQPNQLALAAYLGVDRTVMTYLIDDLVKAGLVRRQQNPLDRRARKIVATKRGREVLCDLEQRVRQAEDDALSALLPAERQVFRDLLRRVACDVREVEEEQPATDTTDACDAVDTYIEQTVGR
ncbi:MAG TPA: MarR family transcriptional regulator [Ktedonobacterales bacterium]|nr:MarR family transcriptional regulator [Ktedonobacterales bacterium]